MTAPTPLLAVRDLEVWFRTNGSATRAVAGVSLTVPPGGRVGVVGESGSGKTQTFFSVLGLGRGSPGVVRGRAEFRGGSLMPDPERFVDWKPADGASVPAKRTHAWERAHRNHLEGVLGQKVTFLFQEPKSSLVPYWRVGEHLAAIQESGTEASGDMLHRLGFPRPEAILDAFPEELSGGQAQRVMLAMALAGGPELVIADEPTTAVDAVSQIRILSALDEACDARGIALVLVSHDLGVVQGMVDTVYVLYAGRVMEVVSAQELAGGQAARRHPYTRQLLESHRRRLAGERLDPNGNGGALRRAETGCPFRYRCPLRSALAPDRKRACDQDAPPLALNAAGHGAACWGLP